jgi:hypothetical protein
LSPVPEYLEPAPLWLTRGKYTGKSCRPGRFLPIRRRAKPAAPIQKQKHCQSLEQRGRLGMAFA